jgi:hypothetical protein
VEQLAQQEVNDRQNIELMSDFTALLPIATVIEQPQDYVKHTEWAFHTKDEYQAKVIQSHVVWRQEEVESPYGSPTLRSNRPYFLLGQGFNGKEKMWLLGCVGADNPGQGGEIHTRYGNIFAFYPDKKSQRRLSELAAVAGSEYPSPAETRQLFDLDKHMLVIKGGTTVKNTFGRNSFHPMQRISDFELGKYDVNSYLHRIATDLSLETELDQLLTKHTSGEETEA